VKWARALLDRLGDGWDAGLSVVRGSATPSAAQRAAAGAPDAKVESPAELLATLERERPDVVFLATRGAMALTLRDAVFARLSWRPAIVTGLPGISIPATTRALEYRAYADAFIVHSVREVEDFERIAAGTALAGRIRLAHLPFLGEVASDRSRDAIIVAPQAAVPEGPTERKRFAAMIVDAAVAQPGLRVVVKVRGLAGEAQTHRDPRSIAGFVEAEVAARGASAPVNLEIAAGALSDHLASAVGLATVSSTAALESLAAGVPTLVLSDFGVSDALINSVFLGSGLIGDASDLGAGRFRQPLPAWAARNYFHDASLDTWVGEVESLAAASAAGTLSKLGAVPESMRSQARYARMSALSRKDLAGSDRAYRAWIMFRRRVAGATLWCARMAQRLGNSLAPGASS
jgi:hypothetical protein